MNIIIGIILFLILLVLLLLLLKVRINIIFDGSLTVYVKALFFKIKLFPSSKKKKGKPKKEKKKKKQKKEKEKQKPDADDAQGEAPAKPTVVDYIGIILDVVKLFFKRFAKHLHIRLATVYIKVASPDAAQTAMLYGATSQAVAYLVEGLNAITNLDRLKSSRIEVFPDFSSDKLEAKINITFSIRLFGVVDMGVRSLLRFLKLKKRASASRAAKARSKLLKKQTNSSDNNEISVKNRKD